MNIYVGNMAYSLTQDQIRDAFEQFGEVESVNVITDRDTGRPKAFGFGEMKNRASVRRPFGLVIRRVRRP